MRNDSITYSKTDIMPKIKLSKSELKLMKFHLKLWKDELPKKDNKRCKNILKKLAK